MAICRCVDQNSPDEQLDGRTMLSPFFFANWRISALIVRSGIPYFGMVACELRAPRTSGGRSICSNAVTSQGHMVSTLRPSSFQPGDSMLSPCPA